MGMGLPRCYFYAVQCLIFLLLKASQCSSFVQTIGHADECSALMQFKQSFTTSKSASLDPFAYPKVASWTKERTRRNCCSWDGVECIEETGYVIGLNLNSSCLYGSLNSSSSLFQLVHLQKLDLSDNHFNFSKIPSRLGHDLTGLTLLNLSQSSFSGQIPSEISYLSKLSTLDLSATSFLDMTFDYDHFSSSKILELTNANLRIIVQNLTNIQQLHLNKVHILSTLPDIFANATSLKALYLQSCGLSGEFPVGIFQLPNLEVLDLMYNEDLTGYFPEFNKSSPFKKLNVARTNFSGHIPAPIGDLSSLEYLNLALCNFYPHIPSSLGNLTQLSYLSLSFFFDHSYTYYDVSRNSFSGQISESWSWVGKLTKLYHLSLAYTYLRGEFPSFVANLTQMEELDLAYNQITGQIPSWLANLTKLTAPYFPFNNLQEAIPRSFFQLTNLQYIDLSSNNLSGTVELDEFFKLKMLTVLRLSFNKLSVHIKTSLTATSPKFKALALASCNLTEFPDFLHDNSKLVELDLSDNNIHGQIPRWMWNSTGESLWYLNLSHNSLTGFEQNPVILPWKNLHLLELGSNRLQGQLPIPPLSIQFYSVPNNGYTLGVSPSFCNLKDLFVLDLSNNNLSGMLPQCLGSSSAFEILKLHNNSFHGDIPDQMCPTGQGSLKMVDMSYNQLRGKLPRSMANCTQLEFLDFGNNHISDSFPSWLGALPVLRVLILGTNGFHGTIGQPATNHEFPNLCIIDLSNNGFSSWLPSDYLGSLNCMKKSVDQDEVKTYFQDTITVATYTIYHYDYSMIIFGKGVELKYLKTPYLLRFIDLSNNRFEGVIPGTIGNLRGLHLLNLSNNTLIGHIPPSLGNLSTLESLDLSQNQLSGEIPSNLAELTFLAYFNVSQNHLSGPIPHGQQFDTFQEDLYKGNSGLCGEPLLKKCEGSDSSMSLPSSEEDEDSGIQVELDWFVVLLGVVSGLVVGGVAGNTLGNRKHEWFVKTFGKRRRSLAR
ncbi:putative leucine-rich repeat-containing, plant-type, leucine-rich repeat domain, L [Rosa chinensis]|uniref:Putative leucine-rich repeat-containing, plant-type, leucine-rich repeat domain, L n=1 Tax=Rosa chinensis TaxID=74649 RepID=A0A2P6S1G0_ROSCH|nr:putative leucine-rich repeat-containing, plant-type, leucine-rich repeat domain, L [Rosa chinensis]